MIWPTLASIAAAITGSCKRRTAVLAMEGGEARRPPRSSHVTFLAHPQILIWLGSGTYCAYMFLTSNLERYFSYVMRREDQRTWGNVH